MTMTRWLYLLLAGSAAATCCPGATGVAVAAGDSSATAFLEWHDAQVREIVLANPEDSLTSADRDRVQALISEAFDFGELARLSLGDHWEERTSAEREEFVAVFSGIIEKQNFDIFVRYHREGNITYTGEELDGAGRAVVHAEVPLRKETKQVSYFLHRADNAGGWRIYDLAIDGAGTADNNRRTYSRYITRHSYTKLLESLRRKLASLESAS